MSGPNHEWALAQLASLIDLLEVRPGAGIYASVHVGTPEEITKQLVVAERIWERFIGPRPDAGRSNIDRYKRERDWAIRCRETIIRDAEIRTNLGEDAPDLNAASMHARVWEGARSLWQSGHYSEAVEAAAKKVNAETQNKVERRDVSETGLFNQVFSADDPAPGSPRLRPPADDGGKTALSVRRGMRAFAEGWYAALRNPLAHEGGELDEAVALEQLAALSILARWVDSSEVRRA